MKHLRILWIILIAFMEEGEHQQPQVIASHGAEHDLAR